MSSALLRIHFVIFVWGMTATLGKVITVDAVAMTWIRTVIATLSLIALKGTSFRLPKANWKGLLAMGVTGLVVSAHWITFFHAIKVSSASLTLICMATTAVFTAILDPVISKKPINPREIGLGMIVILAMGLIFGAEVAEHRAGLMIGLLSAALASLFTIMNSLLVKRYDTYEITVVEMSTSAIVLGALYCSTNPLPQPTPNDWFWLFMLGAICTAWAYLVSIEAMRELTPYTVNLANNLEPVYGIIIALTFLDEEHVSARFWLGSILIFGSILVDALSRRKSTQTSSAIASH
ncbi:MAG: DMT family transporter [Oligoflexales bacterium]